MALEGLYTYTYKASAIRQRAHGWQTVLMLSEANDLLKANIPPIEYTIQFDDVLIFYTRTENGKGIRAISINGHKPIYYPEPMDLT